MKLIGVPPHGHTFGVPTLVLIHLILFFSNVLKDTIATHQRHIAKKMSRWLRGHLSTFVPYDVSDSVGPCDGIVLITFFFDLHMSFFGWEK